MPLCTTALLAGNCTADTLCIAGAYAQGEQALGQALDRAVTEGQASAATAQQAFSGALRNPQVPHLALLYSTADSKAEIMQC